MVQETWFWLNPGKQEWFKTSLQIQMNAVVCMIQDNKGLCFMYNK